MRTSRRRDSNLSCFWSERCEASIVIRLTSSDSQLLKKLTRMILVLCFLALARKIPGQVTAGIGVVLSAQGQDLVVEKVLPDSPAAISKSIQACDRILA